MFRGLSCGLLPAKTKKIFSVTVLTFEFLIALCFHEDKHVVIQINKA